MRFSIDRYSAQAATSHTEVRGVISTFVDKSKPALAQPVSLPKSIAASSPYELFAKASEFRGGYERCNNLLLVALAFRLQVKQASRCATELYKQSLREVYSQKKEDVSSARGFEEREFLARNHISADIQNNRDFWEQCLSDVEDFTNMLKLKMRSFSSALDTVLLQASLLKTANLVKGNLSPAEQEFIEQLKDVKSGVPSGFSKQDEGETSL